MRLRTPLLAACLLASVSSYTRAEQFHLWSHGFGDTLNDDGVAGVAVDADGAIVVAGSMSGSFDFGGDPSPPAGEHGLFIARFTAGGAHLWSRRFGDAASQVCRGMALGPNGDVVITGYFSGTIDFGGGPVTATDQDVFVACFDRDGAHRWSRGFAGAQAQIGEAVAVGADGSVHVTGSFTGGVDLGDGLLSSFGGFDVFLAKYDRDGNHVWSKRFGDSQMQDVHGIDGIAVDGSGNVVCTGQFMGTIDLGGGVMTSAGHYDIYVGKLDPAGNAVWSRRYGNALAQSPSAIACAPGGDIALTGSFVGAIDLGGGEFTAAPPLAAGFLAVWSADATHRWSLQFARTHTNYATVGPVAFSGERVLAAGSVTGSVDLQGNELVSFGPRDVLVLEFDGEGRVVNALVEGGAESESVTGVTATADGGLALAGYYSGAANLGGDPLPVFGATDMFLASYSPADPSYTPILAFSAVLRGGVVEARWHFEFADPAASYCLERRTGPDSRWIVLSEGSAAQHSGGYDDGSVVAGRAYEFRMHMDTGSLRYSSRVALVQVPAVPLALRQNAPNPFALTTRIAYSTLGEGAVVIHIYDAAGRRVARLDQGVRYAGEHAAVWDGRDDSGRPCASGVYFYRLEGIPAAGTRKMLLLR